MSVVAIPALLPKDKVVLKAGGEGESGEVGIVNVSSLWSKISQS